MLKRLLLSLSHMSMQRKQLSVTSSFDASLPAKEWHITGHLTAGSTPNMPHSCALAVVVLAFAGRWCLSAADVGDFTPCLQFFHMSWPPKGLSGTPICQRYLNQYRFATLYSRPRRSPWFSAYLFSVPAGKRPASSWKFEPQVRTLKHCAVS